MPKIKHFIFATLLGIVILAFIAMVQMGLLKPVTITHVEAGPFRLLYKDHVGAYHKVGEAIVAVETFAKEKQIKCERSFGLYMDDPAVVEQARLRSRGGCVIDQAPEIALPEDIKIQEIPRSKFVQGEFGGSPRIGPLRVYPKLLAEISEKKLATAKWGVMEIYEISADSIQTKYLFPLE